MPHQQPIDGEVAALDVFSRSLRINHAVGMTPVAVADIRTKRGDLYFQTVLWDQHDAELRAHGDTPRKQACDLDRGRVRGHVVIGWLAPQKQVAHTPADQQRLILVAFEHLANRIGQCAARHNTRKLTGNLPSSNSTAIGSRDYALSLFPAKPFTLR